MNEKLPSIFVLNNQTDSEINALARIEDVSAVILWHANKLPDKETIRQFHEKNWPILCCKEDVLIENAVHYGKLLLKQDSVSLYEISDQGKINLIANMKKEETIPEISILIPMYQSGRYGLEAIQSIAVQPRKNYELIVVDDGSEDDSAYYAFKALTSLNISHGILALMPHKGQAASRNTALSLASGQWIFYLDADDVLAKDALDNLLKEAEKDPEADGICAMCQDFISPDLTEEERRGLEIKKDPYRRMLSGCTIFHKAVYDKVGKYDETLPSSETAQWMMRMKDCGFKVRDIDCITMYRRYHNNNFGRRFKQTQLKSYMEIIRQRRKKDADKN